MLTVLMSWCYRQSYYSLVIDSYCALLINIVARRYPVYKKVPSSKL